MSASEACRLSVVVTTRNDDHGGAMLERNRIFLDGLVEQARRHGLSGELLIVDWNPPPGSKALSAALHPTRPCAHFPVRYLEVPRELHDRLPYSDEIPLFQMIAKNAGIRRARGRFILATNPDLLFSDALVAGLAGTHLDEHALYRLDRTDVGSEVPGEASLDEQLAWCQRNVLRVHTRWGTAPSWTMLFAADRSRMAGSLRRLGLRRIGRGLLRRYRAWRERAPRHRASRGWSGWLRRAVASGFIGFGEASRRLGWLVDERPKAHTNGCGDFTLLSREAWRRLRGYPELPIWSMHLDSLLCYMALAAGFEERVLQAPARMYHIEHGSSWVTMDSSERLRTFVRKPWLDSALLAELWQEMFQQGRLIEYNGPDWGLGREQLAETVIGGEAIRSEERPAAAG